MSQGTLYSEDMVPFVYCACSTFFVTTHDLISNKRYQHSQSNFYIYIIARFLTKKL